MEGIVKANMITLKKGGYLHKGKKVTDKDVDNFDELVKEGRIEIKASKAADAKKAEKAEDAKKK